MATIEYKCPNCGAALAFDPDVGKVKCDHCGSVYTFDQLSSFYKDKENSFDWGKYKQNISTEHFTNTRVYNCVSCGASLETDENTIATTCPYCGNNVIVDDNVKGGLKPNALIPFSFTKKELGDKIRHFYRDKLLLPFGFFDNNIIEKAQGVYVPFWLFMAKVDGRMYFNAERISRYSDSDYDYVETDYYLLEREGDMEFVNVPVDASKKMDNDLMDSIEPFDFSGMVDFDPAYLTGFVSDRFDSDPDIEIARASKRMRNSARSFFEGTCGTFVLTGINYQDLDLEDADCLYVLLPIYLLNCEYQGKKYRYAINGQTGKVVGDLPVSKAKIAIYALGVFVVIFLFVYLLCLYLQ